LWVGYEIQQGGIQSIPKNWNLSRNFRDPTTSRNYASLWSWWNSWQDFQLRFQRLEAPPASTIKYEESFHLDGGSRKSIRRHQTRTSGALFFSSFWSGAWNGHPRVFHVWL
jgi:hypothetical protein